MLDFIARITLLCSERLAPRVPKNRRGVALVMAMVVIAILSTTILQFSYQTRVNVFVAANARDDLKALYLARSGMNLGVLLLDFQFELEKDPLIGQFMRRSNFQIYPLVNLFLSPFRTGSLMTPVGNLDLTQGGTTGFGGFHGSFDIAIEPEEGKLNVNAFKSGNAEQDKLTQLCLLFSSQQHDDIFLSDLGDRDSKVGRIELVGNIVDWVDDNNTKILLSEYCVPEGAGSGDENAAYTRRDTDFEVKNAPLTTIEELRLVEGFDDAVFERFRDSFTVYPVDKVNLNLANFQVIQAMLCAHVAGASNTNWPCQDPVVLNQVNYLAFALDGIREFFSNPLNLLFYYMDSANAPVVLPGAKKGQTVAYVNTRQLIRYIRAMTDNPEVMQQFIAYSPTARALLGPLAYQVAATAPPIVIHFNERLLLNKVTVNSPKIYRIIATGTYGDTEKTLVAVVDFSKDSRYLYWREY